jgi:hypothetical protein
MAGSRAMMAPVGRLLGSKEPDLWYEDQRERSLARLAFFMRALRPEPIQQLLEAAHYECSWRGF